MRRTGGDYGHDAGGEQQSFAGQDIAEIEAKDVRGEEIEDIALGCGTKPAGIAGDVRGVLR